MLAIWSVTFPFFALIGIGYLAARTGALPVAAVPGLNVFVLYFALTAMLFQLGASTPIGELLDPGARVVLTISGRGDKDVDEVVRVADWDVGVPDGEGA